MAKWQRVRTGLKTELRKCPDCRALVHTADDQDVHERLHYPEPESGPYEYAHGVTVGQPPGTWRQVRDIFRLRAPREEPVWRAEQISADTIGAGGVGAVEGREPWPAGEDRPQNAQASSPPCA